MRYRADIDGLRALAIGLVLLFHAFPSYCRAGFVGVDVFFVISGYLITRILLVRRARGLSVGGFVLDFYEHRVRRIFPALIVVLVSCAIYGWFRLMPAAYESLAKFIAGGAAFVNNFLLWSESGYFDQSIESKPLMHLWSLAIEEQFYIVWPLLILFIARIAAGRYLTMILGLLVLGSFAYGVHLTGADPTAAYYSPLSRGWELGVGGILASIHARGIAAKPTRFGGAVSALALVLVIVGAFFVIDKSQFPGWQALIPVGATAAVIWFGSGTKVDRYLLGTRPIVFVGLISYPLYLWHWGILSFIRIQNPLPPGVVLLGALAVSVGLAAATYYLVERPLKRLKLRTASVAVAVAMVLVFAFALTAYSFKWSGVHLTPMQVALSKEYDPRPDYRFGTCFLDSAVQTPSDFAPECTEASSPDSPTLLIWGDSLAAQLYPGLAAQAETLDYALVQRTASSCPPAIHDSYSDRANCNEINAAVRAYIEEYRPAAVTINGRWPSDDVARAAQIREVIAFLRSNGVQTIVLVGPGPDWQPDLRGILLGMEFPNEALPKYLTPPAATWPTTKALDSNLHRLADDLDVDYLSLIAILCRVDECQIRVSDEIPAGLITSDHDHLTAQASKLVFESYKFPRTTTSGKEVP
jgi:peptidoglycan/LPS O-acetylase OafA/YrhL